MTLGEPSLRKVGATAVDRWKCLGAQVALRTAVRTVVPQPSGCALTTSLQLFCPVIVGIVPDFIASTPGFLVYCKLFNIILINACSI